MASDIPRVLPYIGVQRFSALAPEIVENILSFLPGRSLVNALIVCRLWKDMGKRVLKRRKRWVCKLFECQGDDESTIDNMKQAKQMIWNQLVEFLDNVDTIPSAMVVATNCELLVNKGEMKSFLTKTKNILPVGCTVIGCAAGGIIGETRRGCPEEVESPREGTSVLLFPKVKGVHVQSFSLSKKEISKNKRNKKCWKNSFGTLVEKDIKFIYLIGHNDMHHTIEKVVAGIKKVFGKHVVIIGGLARPFTMLNGKIKCNGVIGLAVGGKVHANSVVHHGSTRQCLPISFQWLTKNQPPAERESACFMVSCIGRGSPFYNSKNVESSEFRNAFPGVRLFGFFGNGEVGTYMPPIVEQTIKESFVYHLHSYCTVFSILTLLDEEEEEKESIVNEKVT